jgi:type I restriction enzyme S subunit
MYNYIPLEQAADILDSYRKPVNSKERLNLIKGKPLDELFPYYGATGQVGWIDSFLTDGEYILLGEDGAPFLNPYAEKAYIIHGKTWVNNHAHILRSKTNNEFLCYYLNYFNYKKYVSGTTRLKLTQAQMRKIPIPNIPSDEQSRIVSRIDELFSELDKAVDTLNTTKEQLAVYRQAVLKDAFSNIPREMYKPLKLVMEEMPQNGLYKSKSFYGEGNPILRIDGFYDGEVVPNYEYKRVRLEAEEIKKYALHIGDIVVNRVNSMSYLGKCALIRNLEEPTIFESNVMRFRLDKQQIDLEYAMYYLSTSFGRHELIKNAKQAVNQASINQTDVGNALIPIPKDLEAQRNIAQKISAHIAVCNNIEQGIDTAFAQADAMRQSILKQAFEGAL